MNPEQKLVDLLKRGGQSVTAPRRAVFSALLGQEPLSMRELAGKVKGVDRASVYRTIAVFERLGIVQRLNTGWKYKIELTDQFTEHHHHLTCTNCGQITDISEAELEQVITQLAQAHQFKPTAHQIEIQGTCQNCQDHL